MDRKTVIVAAIAVVVLGGAIVGIVVAVGGDGVEVAPREGTPAVAFDAGPEVWDAAAERTVTVSVGADGRSPAMIVDGVEVDLDLVPDAAEDVTWEVVEDGDLLRLEAEGALHGRPLRAVWSMAKGNPRAAFWFHVVDVPLDALDEPPAAHVDLPAGEFRYVDRTMRVSPFVGKPVILGPWTPSWMQWRGDADLVVSGVDADRVELSEHEGGVRIGLGYFDRKARGVADCEFEETPAVDVAGRLVLTIGAPSPIFASRFRSGHAAALVPIFTDPADHAEARWHAAGYADARDWARRVRTLAYGHSSPDDPRHGNGGLLGAGLGGTVTVPPEYREDEAATQLLESLAPSRLDVVDEIDPCVAFSEGEIGIAGGAQFEGRYRNDLRPDRLAEATAAPVFSEERPPTFRPVASRGTRAPVTTQLLSELYLRRLVRERGLLLFDAPLMASRNPLVPAAKEALLEPERRGHWTLHEELVRALADVELMREEAPLLVTGAGDLWRYWRDARHAESWYAPDGTVGVTSPATIRGMTLVADGDVRVLVDGEPASSARRVQKNGEVQTWFWFDVDADTPRRVRIEGDGYSPPGPVDWTSSE